MSKWKEVEDRRGNAPMYILWGSSTTAFVGLPVSYCGIYCLTCPNLRATAAKTPLSLQPRASVL